MREIELTEHTESVEHLSDDELSALTQAKKDLGLSIEAIGRSDYVLKPSSRVGAVEVEGLSVLIHPKIGVASLISLACYAMGGGRDGLVAFRGDFDFSQETALPEFIARALAGAAEKAFARGLLHSYVEREEALQTVRGRIRFDEQIRRRFGLPLPVEVRYDEFTDDILPNRLVKAAARRLRGAGPLSPEARRRLGRIDALLDGVSLCEYPRNAVPEVKFDRLNAHYQDVVALSRVILQYGHYEAERGDVRARGFTMDMNRVFQEFLTVALREKLGLYRGVFGEGYASSLDEEGSIALKPDLVWRGSEGCVFVGDAKYKRVPDDAHVPNADLYQLLAYATAIGLRSGMLIYAKDKATEPDETTYKVRNSDKHLHVAALDLTGTLDDVLGRVGGIADRIRKLRDEAVEATQQAA